jgi:hypothetical protein
MPESSARKFFFLIYVMLAVLFLVSGAAIAIEAALGGYGIGLIIVSVMASGFGAGLFLMLALLFAATAIHFRP